MQTQKKKTPRTNLKVFRVKLNLTQDEMADKIGYTRQSYSAIEAGERNGRDAFWNTLQEAFNIPDDEMWALKKND